MSIKVAAIQMCSGMDVERNVETLKALVRDAAGQGAIYIQTPEMTGSLQRNRKALFASIRPEETDLVAKAASELARELNIHLHIGSTAIDLGEGKVANRALLFGPDGQKIASYDKIHMFDVDLPNGDKYRESDTCAAGGEMVVANVDVDVKIGLSVCYDLRFPHLYRKMAQAGADILSIPAAFTVPTGQAHWEVLLRSRAIENGCFVIASAQVGTHEGGRATYGHSMIIAPWGEKIIEIQADKAGYAVAALDLGAVEKARNSIPSLKHDKVIQG
ncbi:MAG: nitrilase [Micavibrio aeruginosavorus]|uniref:Nitrilase n=1 Tax=Micavibrio aeruginosavorus TaxID=349221 RepID=A0A2W5BSM5_9BACT|nr:MAG: nitrilase [Micavibrio aeruginosavorus]